jgi:hypothetical protein
MGKIESKTAPAEVVGAVFKRSEIQESIGPDRISEMRARALPYIQSGISNAGGKQACATLILVLAEYMKTVKAAKAKYVKKLKEAVADVERPYNEAYDSLSDLKERLASVYTRYAEQEERIERERIRKELQEKADREAAERAADAELEAEADMLWPDGSAPEPAVKPVPAPVPEHPADIEVKRSPERVPGVGTLSVTKILDVTIINPDLVPSEYKVPSEQRLTAAWNAGIKSIPGVEFRERLGTRALGART